MAACGHDGLFFIWWISCTSAISELGGMVREREMKKWKNAWKKKIGAEKEKGR